MEKSTDFLIVWAILAYFIAPTLFGAIESYMDNQAVLEAAGKNPGQTWTVIARHAEGRAPLAIRGKIRIVLKSGESRIEIADSKVRHLVPGDRVLIGKGGEYKILPN